MRILKYKLVLRGIQLVLAMTSTASIEVCAQRQLHVSKSGDNSNPGSLTKPILSISSAANKARPGDLVIVHAGIYRELIQPALGGLSSKQRIIYRAAKGEKVEIKGSDVIKGWVSIRKGVWRVSLPDKYFGSYNPYKDLVFGDWFFPGQNRVHTGEVYLNGLPLGEVGRVTQALSWSTDSKADSTVIVAHFGDADPNAELVEINVRPACIYPAKPGVNYITVAGFQMSQAATQWAAPTAEQVGLIGTNWSKGWVIEDCVISDSKCVGIALGKDRASGHNVWFKDRSIDGSIHYNKVVENVLADGWGKDKIGLHVVRRNTIFRCGQAGVCGSFGAAFSEITDNHIYDIYTYRNFWGAEIAGIKLHAGIDALIRGNRVHNAQKGLWLDWMTQGTRISSNLFYDNDYVDIFMEVNHGPYLVDNNLLLSAYNLRDLSQGGAFVHNLFNGLISRAPDSRATPFFQPNSTKLVAVKPISGGDNQFIGNIFVGSRGKIYSPHGYNADSPDSIDSLAGYGLAIYDSAAHPVSASGNVYIGGAYPMATEKDAVIAFDKYLRANWVCMDNSVTLLLNSDFQIARDGLNSINSAVLGKTIMAKQEYTDPKGLLIPFDLDYFGNKRNGDLTFAGPCFWQNGKVLRVWPLKKIEKGSLR